MAKTPFTKAHIDRLIWLLLEIETATDNPKARGTIKVTSADARFVRPIVEAIVKRTLKYPTESPRG
jgi:hypothetical protein